MNLYQDKQGLFWLWDETRAMNLATKAKTERYALIDAIEYYQYRLQDVENQYKVLSQKVDNFLLQFEDQEDQE